jgi:TonB-dependent starch-binding outer membrane protein SusC
LKWDTYFTVSFNRNKLTDLGGLDNLPINSNIVLGQHEFSLLKIGMPLGEFYGYRFLGTWKSSDTGWGIPGSAKYVYVKGDNPYNNATLMPLGNSQPKYTFGFTNEVTYRNFSLNLMFLGTYGNQSYSQTIALTYENFTSKDALNVWTSAHETNFPASYDVANSSRYVYDASYIKLKNISLSYRVPEKIFNNVQFRYLEVYVSGQNIITITRFPGFDPEVTNGINAMTQGLELGDVPNPKTYTFGLRLGF